MRVFFFPPFLFFFLQHCITEVFSMTDCTFTLSPGNAISGLDVMAIFARACAALTFPASVLSVASGIRACTKAKHKLLNLLKQGVWNNVQAKLFVCVLPFLPPVPPLCLCLPAAPQQPKKLCREKMSLPEIHRENRQWKTSFFFSYLAMHSLQASVRAGLSCLTIHTSAETTPASRSLTSLFSTYGGAS